MPVHITTVKRAVSLLYIGAAKGVDPQYQTYSWEELSVREICSKTEKHFWSIQTLSSPIPVPKVIVLNQYDKLPQRSVRFSRTHVFMRDQYMCQYCGDEFPKQELNLDHVMPRSRGGSTSWENLVTSCHTCNRRKGSRTPAEANMPLLSKPKKPAGTFGLINLKRIHEAWSPFLLTN